MSSLATAARRAGLVLLVVSAAACGQAVRSSPSIAVAAPTVATSDPTAGPTEVPGPPAATLRGTDPAGIAGELGTFSWDGLVSDAPWLVSPVAGTARAGAPLQVVFAPGLPRGQWNARWAAITDGAVGSPADGGEGGGGAITVVAPTRPGRWSLGVTASFGPGRNGTWYWRVDVGP